jgi:hypothetical protein
MSMFKGPKEVKPATNLDDDVNKKKAEAAAKLAKGGTSQNILTSPAGITTPAPAFSKTLGGAGSLLSR